MSKKPQTVGISSNLLSKKNIILSSQEIMSDVSPDDINNTRSTKH